MPKPRDARRCEDGCVGCPLRNKAHRPFSRDATPRPNIDCLIIVEHPGPDDALLGEPLQGPPGRFFSKALRDRGIENYAVIYRIACFPSTQAKRLDKNLRAAAACCEQRFMAQINRADPNGKLPRLFIGKHSTDGVLTAYQWRLTSGATAKIPHAALVKGIPLDGTMCLDHPRVPSWYKTASQPPWYASLDRFAAIVHGVPRPSEPQIHIHPDETAISLLKRMGPAVGWDVETLGADPLAAAITCIGISDGDHTVVIPWEPYDTARHGRVLGIEEYGELGRALKAEVCGILSSDRLQCTQNGTYDTLAMSARKQPGRNDFDILHAHKILWPEIPASLEAIGVHVVKELTHRWKTVFRAGRDDDSKGSDAYRDSAQEDLRHYCGMDCWVTIKAYHTLNELLDQED